jgi:hypothetical protein
MRPDIPAIQKTLAMDTVDGWPLVHTTAAAFATHRAASDKLYQIKDCAFEYAGAKLSAGRIADGIQIATADRRAFGGGDGPPPAGVGELATRR